MILPISLTSTLLLVSAVTSVLCMLLIASRQASRDATNYRPQVDRIACSSLKHVLHLPRCFAAVSTVHPLGTQYQIPCIKKLEINNLILHHRTVYLSSAESPPPRSRSCQTRARKATHSSCFAATVMAPGHHLYFNKNVGHNK